jgi:chromosomal replication initiation ATPase DnaA
MIIEFSKLVGIPELELLGKSHARRISDARQIYWHILSGNGFSRTEIAKLNDRDHSTITNGIKRVKGLLETGDAKITEMYDLTKNIKR